MFVKIENLNIHYEMVGQGIPLVLLHCWGQSLETFYVIRDALAENFCVCALDFPGFGKSDEPAEPWEVADYVRFLKNFLLSLSLESPVLLGHSFGGRIAIYYSTQNLVKKIILVNSAGIVPRITAKRIILKICRALINSVLSLSFLRGYQEGIREKLRNIIGSSDYKKATRLMQQTLSKVVSEDLREKLSMIKVPTLLIWGEQDSETPIGDAKIMEQLIPDAGLVVFNGVGHFSYLERPKEFVLIVKEFLKEDKV